MPEGRSSDSVPIRIDRNLTQEQLDEALWIVVRAERALSGNDLLAAMRDAPTEVRGASLISTLAALQKHADPDSYFAHLRFRKSGKSWVVAASEESRKSYEQSQARQLMGQKGPVVEPTLEQRVAETLSSFEAVPLWPEERAATLRELAEALQKEGDLGTAALLLYGHLPAIERFRFLRLLDEAGGVFLAQSHKGEMWVASPVSRLADDTSGEFLLKSLRDAAKSTAEEAGAIRRERRSREKASHKAGPGEQE